ncbi:MAG: serine/threonine-protein kinase, partial [Clostridia bacterium]|nr:serine/threonine-protein kinase [Clostridia bacterium]
MEMRFPERLKALEPFWGAWRLNACVGEGSYGKVFKIVRTDLGSEYIAALKWIYIPHQDNEIDEMRSEGMSDEDIRFYYDTLIKSFTNEIRMMSELGGNSHIVNYLDHIVIPRRGEIGWDIFIRMEYLTPLDKYIRAHNFSERDVVTVGWHICQALALCARHKILHRDIKPDNIFRSSDGNYKLGDFGVSRTLEGTRNNLSIKGTPLYMAPEVLTGNQATFSADVYSLGLVLYRLLNRQRMPCLPLYDLPTHDNREKALQRRIRGDVLPEPADGCRDIKRIVLKACAYNPDDRYATAEEMGTMFEKLLKRGRLSDAPLFPENAINQMNSERSSLHPDVKEMQSQHTRLSRKNEAPREENSAIEDLNEIRTVGLVTKLDDIGSDINSGAKYNSRSAANAYIKKVSVEPKRAIIPKKSRPRGGFALIICLILAIALFGGGAFMLFRDQPGSAN